jgi:ribose 5-phosphate isomerase A
MNPLQIREVGLDAKEVAARRAVAEVRDGMIIGLGTGSTAAHAIRILGERIQAEGIRIQGVPTSARSKEQAEQLGIPLVDFAQVERVDMTIDGADEVDPNLHLIKGGGGALVQEKIVASATRDLLIICDPSKVKAQLGAFPLPIAIIPFGWQATLRKLRSFGYPLHLRTDSAGDPYRTDDRLYIVDMQCGEIPDPPALEQRIKSIIGVAEVGLFTGLTRRVIVGNSDGSTQILERP